MQSYINNHIFFLIQFNVDLLNFKLIRIFYIHHLKLIGILIFKYRKYIFNHLNFFPAFKIFVHFYYLFLVALITYRHSEYHQIFYHIYACIFLQIMVLILKYKFFI